MKLLAFSHYGKTFDLLFAILFFFVGAGISTSMSISDGLGYYFFCRKVEKTRPLRKEMDRNVFSFRQAGHFRLYSLYG